MPRAYFIREAIVLGLWIFLVWLGLSAIDRHYGELLGVYVFVAASAVAGLLGWRWRKTSN